VVEIGYAVMPPFQGRGYATEMVRAIVKWAFQQPGVGKVVAETERQTLQAPQTIEGSGAFTAFDARR
jgi:[ribosomal protein S5]-alanine N-acetyltransferase